MGDLGHAARLLGLLRLTVDEFEAARAAFLDNVRRQDAEGTTEQEALFREGGRLAVVVHLRIESFRAFAQAMLERLGGGPPEVAELFRPDRDFHVRLDDRFVASILASSGDAQIAPFGEGLDLRQLLARLEERFPR